MVNHKHWVLFDLESFLLVSGVSGFLFLPYSIFENLETTESFLKVTFGGIKAICLMSVFF